MDAPRNHPLRQAPSGRRITRAVRLAAAGALAACAAPPVDPPRPPGQGTVEVTIVGMDSDRGQVLVNLFTGPQGFPDDPTAAHAAVAAPIVGGRAVVRFERVPAGGIAVSVFHDLDLDRRLATGLFGLPAEPWGVSGTAEASFGPPSFPSARIELEPGTSIALEIRVD
jgi:uncharacterized protein (DUF2141 family)